MSDYPEPPAHEDHELGLLRYAHGEADDSELDALAQTVASCSDCLSYLMQLIDDTHALHDLARSRMLDAGAPGLASVKRIDALLDDVMVLMADRGGPAGGGQKTEKQREREVPVGKGQRG